MIGDFEFFCFDFLVEDTGIGIFERQEAAKHSVEHDSATPDVAFNSLVVFADFDIYI
jgi:hypothetical protein